MVLEVNSVSHGKASPFQPVLDLLHGYFGIIGSDHPSSRPKKVSARLAVIDAEPTLPTCLRCSNSGQSRPAGADGPAGQAPAHVGGLKLIILRESLKQPLVVIFEDLHFIDAETQAVFEQFVGGIVDARNLLVVSYRPEYRHERGGKRYYTQLRLDPLGRETIGELLTAVLGDAAELSGRCARLVGTGSVW